MAGNSIGERFRVTTFGESHGGGLGVVIDGCPAGHRFPHERITAQLARRRPGQSALTTARDEADAYELLSGVDPITGLTIGSPIAMVIRNRDQAPQHYADLAKLYRPSHADYTYDARFAAPVVPGGGRASARETVARVAAGALAEDLLAHVHGVEIVAWVERVAEHSATSVDEATIDRAAVDHSPTRCPDPEAAAAIEAAIRDARKHGDTLGGVVRCVVRNVPAGWGEPVFGKLTAELAAAMMSLPASRGFEIGEGFAATRMRGSTHNDAFYLDDASEIRTRTNHSGGIQGGISNGEAIRFAVAFKPVATIFKPQQTVTRTGEPIEFTPNKGRHDPCVLPRAVPMVEAMAALVLCDAMLRRAGARIGDLDRGRQSREPSTAAIAARARRSSRAHAIEERRLTPLGPQRTSISGTLPFELATELRMGEPVVWWGHKEKIDRRPILWMLLASALLLGFGTLLAPELWSQPLDELWQPLLLALAPAALLTVREWVSLRAVLVTDSSVIVCDHRGYVDRIAFRNVRRVGRDWVTGGILLEGAQHKVRIPPSLADDTRAAIDSQTRFAIRQRRRARGSDGLDALRGSEPC